jgi:hypothetical protein
MSRVYGMSVLNGNGDWGQGGYHGYGPVPSWRHAMMRLGQGPRDGPVEMSAWPASTPGESIFGHRCTRLHFRGLTNR